MVNNVNTWLLRLQPSALRCVTSPCCCRLCVWLSVMLGERLGCRDRPVMETWLLSNASLLSLLSMNSEEEFYDAETGETHWQRSHAVTCTCCVLFFFTVLLSPSGLESDDSCEVSFKDALVFDNKQVTDGCATQENGVWERRWGILQTCGMLTCMCACYHMTNFVLWGFEGFIMHAPTRGTKKSSATTFLCC